MTTVRKKNIFTSYDYSFVLSIYSVEKQGLACVLHQADPILKSFVKCIDCKLYHGCIVRERPFYTSEWIDFGSGKIVGEMF